MLSEQPHSLSLIEIEEGFHCVIECAWPVSAPAGGLVEGEAVLATGAGNGEENVRPRLSAKLAQPSGGLSDGGQIGLRSSYLIDLSLLLEPVELAIPADFDYSSEDQGQ